MTGPAMIALDGPVVHQVAAPAFHTGVPDVRFARLMPPDILAVMLDRWQTPVPGHQIRFHSLRDVYVVGEGLVFDRKFRLYADTVSQHDGPMIEAAYDRLRAADAAGDIPHQGGSTLLCGKLGMSNYGHWLLEMLPVAYLSRRWIAAGWKVFLPLLYPWMEGVIFDSLAALGIPRGRCIANDGAPQHFEELVFVSGVSSVGLFYLPVAVECMQSVAVAMPSAGSERVWVSRLDDAANRRSLQDEAAVCRALQARGWTILEPAGLPLEAQAAALKSARHIAGVAGGRARQYGVHAAGRPGHVLHAGADAGHLLPAFGHASRAPLPRGALRPGPAARHPDPRRRHLIDRPARGAGAAGSVEAQCLWIGSIQATPSGFSTGSMSRFTTTASLSLRTRTHSSVSSVEALISWCGTYGGTKMKSPGPGLGDELQAVAPAHAGAAAEHVDDAFPARRGGAHRSWRRGGCGPCRPRSSARRLGRS